MFAPRRLVFAGGGTRCLVFLPALKILEQAGRLAHVGEWWGTSAGSLCATLMALTRSVARVEEIMHSTEYVKFRDVNLMNMMNIQNTWGLDDGRGLQQEIEAVLEKAVVGGSQKTMADVSGLRIVVADLTVYETVVCSAANYPTLRVADAVRASMSLPIFYTPFRNPVNGHLWVDGGLRQGFPWECLESDDARREALGFAFERGWTNGPRTCMEYVFSMVHFEEPTRIRRMKAAWSDHIVWFPTPPFPPWYVRLTAEDFAMLREMGEAAAKDWLTRRSSPGISESRLYSEHQSTPAPSRHHDGTDESSDSHPPSLRTSRPPFRDPQSRSAPSFRRWSL